MQCCAAEMHRACSCKQEVQRRYSTSRATHELSQGWPPCRSSSSMAEDRQAAMPLSRESVGCAAPAGLCNAQHNSNHQVLQNERTRQLSQLTETSEIARIPLAHLGTGATSIAPMPSASNFVLCHAVTVKNFSHRRSRTDPSSCAWGDGENEDGLPRPEANDTN